MLENIRKVHGPYFNREGRQIVIVVYTDGHKKTKTYARWVMEKHLNRELDSSETVDHIDGNVLNDKIENLQILSRGDNIRKHHIDNTFIHTSKCPTCGKLIERRLARVVYDKDKRKIAGPFCSKKCVGKMFH